MVINLFLIFFTFFNLILCAKPYKFYKNKCYEFIYLDLYLKCIICSNERILENCINKYGNNLYTYNSKFIPINPNDLFINCENNSLSNNKTSNEKITTAKNLKVCFSKIKKLNHICNNINCKKYI